MKRFLGVLVASMFLASAAFAADAPKEEKKADAKDAKATEKKADAKDAKASEKKADAKAKTEKAKDTKEEKK